jgi:hypothetical protein
MINQTRQLSWYMVIALVMMLLGFNAAAIENPTGTSFQNGQGDPPIPRPFVVPPANSAEAFPFPQALVDRFDVSSASLSGPIDYVNTSRVTDDIESISMRVPRSWRDVESGLWVVDGQTVGRYITAAPDLHEFTDGSGSGVFFGVSRSLVGNQAVSNPALMVNPAVSQLLLREQNQKRGRCQNNGRFAYADNYYQGEYDLYMDCSTGQTGQIILATTPAHQSYISLVRITVNSEADLIAANQILNTFQVLNPSLEDEHHEDDGHEH